MIGVPELDLKILVELSDSEISQLCQVNQYINKLCQIDYLWQLRSKKYLSKVLSFRKLFPSWAAFYWNVRYNSVYLAIVGDELATFSTIEGAYQYVLKQLEVLNQPPIERVEELQNVNTVYMGMIYITLGATEFQANDPERLLLRAGDPENFLVKPNLEQYPRLAQTGLYFAFDNYTIEESLSLWYLDPNSTVIIGPPSTELLNKITSESTLGFSYSFSLLQPDQPKEEIFFTYPTLNQTTAIKSDPEVIFIDRINGEYKMAVLPKKYYPHLVYNPSYSPPNIIISETPELSREIYSNLNWLSLEHLRYHTANPNWKYWFIPKIPYRAFIDLSNQGLVEHYSIVHNVGQDVVQIFIETRDDQQYYTFAVRNLLNGDLEDPEVYQ